VAAGIKLGSVASSITGTASTAMIEAQIGGERRGGVLADLAIGRMRTAGKLAGLSMALAGRFTEHHALLCRLHRDRIAVFDDAVDGLDKQITGKAARWQREAGLLTSVPGFGDVVAQAWLGEIGPAPHRHFATHEKLASWVTLCPGNDISARKRKHGRTGDAGTYIKPMLIQAALDLSEDGSPDLPLSVRHGVTAPQTEILSPCPNAAITAITSRSFQAASPGVHPSAISAEDSPPRRGP
jgi:hypothetical protein